MKMFYFLAFYFTVFGIAVEVRVSSLLLDLHRYTNTHCVLAVLKFIHRDLFRLKDHTVQLLMFPVCKSKQNGELFVYQSRSIQNRQWCYINFETYRLFNCGTKHAAFVQTDSLPVFVLFYIMPSIKNLSVAYNAAIACYFAPSN